jgi:hypothetical protein
LKAEHWHPPAHVRQECLPPLLPHDPGNEESQNYIDGIMAGHCGSRVFEEDISDMKIILKKVLCWRSQTVSQAFCVNVTDVSVWRISSSFLVPVAVCVFARACVRVSNTP